MFECFLSLGKFVSRYNIWKTLTFERSTQMPDERIHDRTLGARKAKWIFLFSSCSISISYSFKILVYKQLYSVVNVKNLAIHVCSVFYLDNILYSIHVRQIWGMNNCCFDKKRRDGFLAKHVSINGKKPNHLEADVNTFIIAKHMPNMIARWNFPLFSQS